MSGKLTFMAVSGHSLGVWTKLTWTVHFIFEHILPRSISTCVGAFYIF